MKKVVEDNGFRWILDICMVIIVIGLSFEVGLQSHGIGQFIFITMWGLAFFYLFLLLSEMFESLTSLN